MDERHAVLDQFCGRRPSEVLAVILAAVVEREGALCAYCGVSGDAGGLIVDLALPRSRGGRAAWGNLLPTCYDCLREKGEQTPLEYVLFRFERILDEIRAAHRRCRLRQGPRRPGKTPQLP